MLLFDSTFNHHKEIFNYSNLALTCLLALDDERIPNVVTYVLNTCRNNGGEVTPAQVKAVRK